VSASEKKKYGRAFIRSNHNDDVRQVFETMEEHVEHLKPKVATDIDSDELENTIDCCVAGMPCQAWAQNREKKAGAPNARQGMIADHPGYKIMFDTFEQFLADNRGRLLGGINEQTASFANEWHSAFEDLDAPTPKRKFDKMLSKHGFYRKTVKLNLDDWIDEPSRPRLYTIFVNDELGGKEGLDWIISTIEDFAWALGKQLAASIDTPKPQVHLATRDASTQTTCALYLLGFLR
jgi:hypothetical protein